MSNSKLSMKDCKKSYWCEIMLSKKDKQCCVLSAIYRMLRQKKVTFQQAEKLLQTRAFYKEHSAGRIINLWKTSYPIKKAWGLK